MTISYQEHPLFSFMSRPRRRIAATVAVPLLLLASHAGAQLNVRNKVQSLRGYRSALVALVLIILGEAGVAEAAAPGGCPASGARVFLKSSGVVVLNGRLVEAAKLKDALAALNPKPTVICYSRDNPQGEPPSTMEAVLQALMSQGLPIGLFTDATFATPVSPN